MNQSLRSVTTRSRFDKSLNTLLGIIEGVSIDGVINQSESQYLQDWLDQNRDMLGRAPFDELHELVTESISDSILDQEEREDINFLCKRLTSSQFYNSISVELQRLHGVLCGIAADGKITAEEVKGLEAWVSEHQQLKSCWPFDEIEALVCSVLEDEVISESEEQALLSFFSEFSISKSSKAINNPIALIGGEYEIKGVCALCPDIEFAGKEFCVTGESEVYSRAEFNERISAAGGGIKSGVSKKVDYLVVGADGSPYWAYSCYGRKVEKAIELRKEGYPLTIVHEFDVHDALNDLSN